MATWLVTGGAGFIGGNFVLEAVARGIRVVNLDALTYAGNLNTLASLEGNPDHVFVKGDIGDGMLVARLLQEHQPDAVLNFAAESHVDRSIEGPGAFIHTNVVGTLALLEAVRDYWKSLPTARSDAFRFLHVSTDEVYGTLGETGKFTETTPYAPNSPYSASKAASDHLVRAFHHTYGLPVLTTNVRTIMVRTTSPKSSFRWSSPKRLPASRCRSTATASRCATGCSSATTAKRFVPCWRRARSARPTTWAAIQNARISKSCRRSAPCWISTVHATMASRVRARSPM